MRIRTQRRKSLPETAKLTQVCQDAGFTKTVAKAVVKRQYFVTRSAIEVDGQGITACREYTHPRNEHKSSPKGRIGNNTKTGPALDVLVTEQFDQWELISKLIHWRQMDHNLGSSSAVER